ncbi:MAG TPA: hypothetical protein VGS61_02180, partial [Acidimicrobiales bacterium]|nr:hypothetical protein [Acidimicrobiales bacterium]
RPLVYDMARRAFLDARTRTIVFGYVFGIYAWLQAAGYRGTYPTPADRMDFAHAFAGNDAIRVFYGYPYDVVSIGGYCAWRVGGTLSLAAAVYGVLAAVRALRAEEDAGRTELVLAGAVSRRSYYVAALSAVGLGTVTLFALSLAGYLVGGLPLAGSAFLALSTALVVPLFAGIGAVACQLAPTRRGALALGSSAFGLFWLLRMIADTWRSGGFLRWATPLGWAEGSRPFAGSHWWPLVALAAAAVPPLVWAGARASRRDVGVGLFAPRDRARARLRFLGGPTAQSLRLARNTLLAWALGFAVFATVLGMVSTSISAAGISKTLRTNLSRLGEASILTPTGYLSFVFVIFVVAFSYFACSQVNAVRTEEVDEELETLLAQPVARRRWLAGRLGASALVAVVLAEVAGFFAWAGAASQGVRVSLARMLEAGANCLPTAALFLGVGVLVYALAPRASAAINYALVSVAFLWYVVGTLFTLPHWVIEATPYQHIGYVPAQAFRPVAAAVMLGIGLVGALAALEVFRRRDLLGS